jgi:hypothetical protein
MRKRKSWTTRAKGVILSVSEIERRQLHKEVENIMSDDSAAVLMRLLPPVSWNDFATKQDLETLGNFMQLSFNNSMLELRNEMRKEFVDETGILRNGMQDEVASLRKEMYTEFSAMRSEMNTGFLDLRKEMNNQTHRMFMAMLGINTLLMSVAIAAFKLL